MVSILKLPLKIKKLKEAQQKEKEAKGRKFKNLLADLKKYQTIEKSDLDDETKRDGIC